MGGNGSSSKRKPSKKKSSKNYSQVSRKKKIRRNESKKRGRRHDSDDHSINSASISTSTSESDYKSRKNKYKKTRRDYSISSDDNSMNSASDSPSNSHNDYRSRKAKSGLQRRRKRARERSISPDRNKDSHRVRKRKRSKRNHDVKPKKKSLKKSKKQMSVSSSSSDSQSCPTRRSRSSDRTTEIERAKVILDKEKERVRGRGAHKVHRKRKVRSPSCSSCSRDSDHSVSQTEEVAEIANSSRRLRSVIAVVEHPHDKEENKWEADPNKEEIVYNHDDFPSPRSIESDDVGRNGESEYHSHWASSKKSRVETVTGEEVTKHSFTGMEGSDQKNNTGDTKSNEVDSNTFEKKTIADVSVSDTDLGGDDLESILRQKALENLRNFRGGLQTRTIANLKIDNESDVSKFSSAGADVIQNKSIKQDSSNVACLTREMDHSSMPTLTRDLSHYKKIKKDITGHDDVGKECRANKQNVIHPSDGAALSIHSENEDCSTAHAVITKPPSSTDLNQGAGATNACSSAILESTCVEPTSGEHTLKDQQNEAKDSSQFEQKRMSVMRGGEMVEVSYKVYIPKRAPALARRQLRR
ncbi:splicing regulatory glutamine/lysine-rich protein 1 [Forsythia ovata]|uniref:Splicing regulatory glutamine/lysine-rich protein 1 n=1 Tax=Forsythia ovata TaxID=205694 RepID=A0ABD1S6Q2_9LAMI